MSKKLVFGFVVICSWNVLLHKDYIHLELGGIHTTRQCQTQWNIINFHRYDNNILNPRIAKLNIDENNIYRYEFPLIQWVVAQLYRCTGESVLVTRIAFFILSLFGGLGLLLLLNTFTKSAATILTVVTSFFFTPVIFYYSNNPLPDVGSLAFTFWALYFSVRFIEEKSAKHLYLGATMLCVATLCKLPYVVFGGIIFIYFAKLAIDKRLIQRRALIQLNLTCLILSPALFWYMWVIPQWKGNGITTGIFGADFDFVQFLELFYYHISQLFPNRIITFFQLPFVILGIYKLVQNKHKFSTIHYGLGLSSVTVLFYYLTQINMIGTVHDYYLMPFVVLFVLLFAYGFPVFKSRAMRTVFCALFILIFPMYTYHLTAENWDPRSSVFNQDLYLYKCELRNAVPKEEKCIILNDYTFHVLPYMLDKRGYVFEKDYLPSNWVKNLIKDGKVGYMYSDSKVINSDSAIQSYVEDTLLVAGSIKVFKFRDANNIVD